MRVRSILITTVAGVAFVGASATAAHAVPKGPGVLSPTPTTVKPDPPKQCCDKIAPTPTTQPPKGPGDIATPPADPDPDPKGPDDLAPAPKGGDNPKPKGPGDLAPAPKGGGNTDNGGTGNGSGTDNGGSNEFGTGGGSNNTDNGVGSDTDEGRVISTDNANTETADSHHAADESSSKMPAFLIIFFALMVAGLIAFVATRMRSEDEDVEQI